MNLGRLALATIGGFVAYFTVGTAIFFLVPQMIVEGHKYPAVFRDREGMMARMPALMLATLFAILAITVIYAVGYQDGAGLAAGACFGALIGLFVVCAFVVHNYVNLAFGLKLVVMQGLAYFVEWTAVGTAIGLIYKP